MIVNIRGCSGSGKSTLVKDILYSTTETLYDPLFPKQILGYEADVFGHPFRILGRYNIACGGVDALSGEGGSSKGSVARADKIVREWHEEGHNVLFEGLMVSSVWGRWERMSGDFPGQMIFVFLNTPLEVCYDRILQRNGGKPVSRKNVEDKWKNCRQQLDYCKATPNLIAYEIDYEHSLEEFEAIF